MTTDAVEMIATHLGVSEEEIVARFIKLVTTAPRAVCWACLKEVAIRKDGLYRFHKYGRGCPGSHTDAMPVLAKSISRTCLTRGHEHPEPGHNPAAHNKEDGMPNPTDVDIDTPFSNERCQFHPGCCEDEDMTCPGCGTAPVKTFTFTSIDRGQRRVPACGEHTPFIAAGVLQEMARQRREAN